MGREASPTPYVDVPDAVEALQNAFLTEPRDEERGEILLRLGRLGNEEQAGAYPYRESVARTLVELYNLSVWWPEKRAILRAMGECRGSVVTFRYLLRLLDTFDLEAGPEEAELVTAVLDAFGRIGLAAVGPIILRRYLGPGVPELVRLQGIEVLGHLGFRQATDAIVAALDEGGAAPIVALYSLTELVSRSGIAKVENLLSGAWASGELEWDDDRELARAALTYLCSVGAKEAERWLARLRYTHGPDLRTLALWGRRVLRQNSGADMLDLITSALDEEDEYSRIFFGRSLCRFEVSEVIEAAEELCDSHVGVVRLIETVSGLGGDEVSRWLWARFIEGDSSPEARTSAIRSLRELTDAEGRRLLALAKRAEPDVAVAAIEAAGNFGPLSLHEGLCELLAEGTPWVKRGAVRAIQHIVLAHRPAHVSLRQNKGEARRHLPGDLPLDAAALGRIDTQFRQTLRRCDDSMTQGLVAYAAANLRRTELWPRVLKLAEKGSDMFCRMAAYHALLDMPDPQQVDRLVTAFATEDSRVARVACLRTLAPLLASLPTPDDKSEEALLEVIADHVDEASEVELITYAHALGLSRAIDPLGVLDRIAGLGGYRSNLEVISALGALKHLGEDPILYRIDVAIGDGDVDASFRAIESLERLATVKATDRLLDLLVTTVHPELRERAIRALAGLGRHHRGLAFSAAKLDSSIDRVSQLLRDEDALVAGYPTRTLHEDLLDLKLALWQSTSGSGVDDERVNRVIGTQLGAGLEHLTRYGAPAEEVLRALRGAEFFHLQSPEMPLSADLSPAILSYTKAIELWLHIRLTSLLGGLREVAKESYGDLMAGWESYEVKLRSLVKIPVEDSSRAIDWTKVPRVAKAMKEKKFTADWRTLSISNSGAIILFYGIDAGEFGARNALGLSGPTESTLSVAVNSLALAALRNAMAHQQSATRQDLDACRTLAYEVMRGIAAFG